MTEMTETKQAASSETLRVQLIQQGAVACLFKPFSDSALLDALYTALGMT